MKTLKKAFIDPSKPDAFNAPLTEVMKNIPLINLPHFHSISKNPLSDLRDSMHRQIQSKTDQIKCLAS